MTVLFCFFFNDTATTEIYTYGHTLSLHDALPILRARSARRRDRQIRHHRSRCARRRAGGGEGAGREAEAGQRPIEHHDPRPLHPPRSEEHTSELQSLMRISYAVFCLQKKTINSYRHTIQTIQTHL